MEATKTYSDFLLTVASAIAHILWNIDLDYRIFFREGAVAIILAPQSEVANIKVILSEDENGKFGTVIAETDGINEAAKTNDIDLTKFEGPFEAGQTMVEAIREVAQAIQQRLNGKSDE